MCGPLRIPLLILSLSLLLSNCVSHEARQLVPSISLSPDATLSDFDGSPSTRGGADLGLSLAVDEDRLGNVADLPGVRIRAVTPGGPADMAGLLPGDIILGVDGETTNYPDSIETIALATTEAHTFRMEIRRDTAVFDMFVSVTPDSSPRQQAVERYRADPILLRAGFITERLPQTDGSTLSGARLVRIFDDSPLPAQLQIDDIILAVDQQPVESAQGLINLLHRDYGPGDRVALRYLRGDDQYSQRLQLWDPGRRLSRVSLWPLFRYESSLTQDQTRVTVLDLWLFSLFSYRRDGGEREYSVLGLFRSASGYGELMEE